MLSTGVLRVFRGNPLARIRLIDVPLAVASIINDPESWWATPDAIASLFGMPTMGWAEITIEPDHSPSTGDILTTYIHWREAI
jgi:hypothetical protein